MKLWEKFQSGAVVALVLFALVLFYRQCLIANWHPTADALVILYVVAGTIREKVRTGTGKDFATDLMIISAFVLLGFIGWAYFV